MHQGGWGRQRTPWKAEEMGKTVDKAKVPGIRWIRGRLKGCGRQPREWSPTEVCRRRWHIRKFGEVAEGRENNIRQMKMREGRGRRRRCGKR